MSYKRFEELAERYDAWFDRPDGRAIFAAEVASIKSLLPADLSGWVEVGVGTGRFAAVLGVPEGIEPSGAMLKKAEERGIRTTQGKAEQLPYRTASLDGILLAVTLCFLDAPEEAMREFARVLKKNGLLVVGIVPAESRWGGYYQAKGKGGHPFYSVAVFYTCEQVKELAASAGFTFVRGTSTLPTGPDEELERVELRDGVDPGCGFVSMVFRLSE
jgi:SAM-dependent methyltransferase